MTNGRTFCRLYAVLNSVPRLGQSALLLGLAALDSPMRLKIMSAPPRFSRVWVLPKPLYSSTSRRERSELPSLSSLAVQKPGRSLHRLLPHFNGLGGGGVIVLQQSTWRRPPKDVSSHHATLRICILTRAKEFTTTSRM
jgi:hypothetical protein